MRAQRRKADRASVADRQKIKGAELATTDVGRFAEALRNGQRELLSAANVVRDEFSLGPRGVWILGLIATGRVKTQSDVVKRYRVGRSIIAEEMAPLIKGGLVKCERIESDKRHLSLSLTPLGEQASRRLGEALDARIKERLGDTYTVGDLLFCTDLLCALGGGAAETK